MSDILLFFTNPYLCVFILTSWYVYFNSKRLVNLSFIFIFINGALNSILKFIFKSPLHESLNNPCWYSLPSGHMQYALVFGGIMWIHNRYSLKLLVALILFLAASGWVMSLKNYHTLFEMICAIPPAIIIIYIYNTILKRISLLQNNLLWLNITSLSIQLTTLWTVESPCTYYKLNWMWLNIGANIGFMIQSLVVKEQIENIAMQLKKSFKQPFFYCFSLLIIVELAITYSVLNIYKTELVNLICGFLLTSMLFLTSKLYQRFNTK